MKKMIEISIKQFLSYEVKNLREKKEKIVSENNSDINILVKTAHIQGQIDAFETVISMLPGLIVPNSLIHTDLI